MRFHTMLVAGALVANVGLARGDDARAVPLELDDLIRAALATAPEMVRAQILRDAARDAAAGEKRAQAWVVTATASYDRSALAENADVPAGELAGQATSSVHTRLERNLPTGGAVKLELGLDRNDSECSISTRQSVLLPGAALNPCGYDLDGRPYETMLQEKATARATIQQPLSRGFGHDIALAPEIRANYAFTETTLEARAAAEELLRDLVIAYWDLALASYELDVRAAALALANKQHGETQQLVAAGVVPETAMLSVKYEIQVRAEALLRARVDLETKSLELRRRAGLAVNRRDLILRPVSALEIGDTHDDPGEVLARSLRRNTRLGKIAQQALVAGVDVAVAKDQTKPKIDLALSGAVIGMADDASGAFDTLGKRGAYEVTASLSVSFEISNAAQRKYASEVKKAKLLDLERVTAEQQIETDVVGASSAVVAARERVALSDTAIDVSQKIVKATQQSFGAGRTTIDQVVLKQKELVEAQLTRGTAVADYHKAVAKLEFLSGALFDHYRIDASPR